VLMICCVCVLMICCYCVLGDFLWLCWTVGDLILCKKENPTVTDDHRPARSNQLNGWSTDSVFANPTQSVRIRNYYPKTRPARPVPTPKGYRFFFSSDFGRSMDIIYLVGWLPDPPDQIIINIKKKKKKKKT
jgi:hypothetical protein